MSTKELIPGKTPDSELAEKLPRSSTATKPMWLSQKKPSAATRAKHGPGSFFVASLVGRIFNIYVKCPANSRTRARLALYNHLKGLPADLSYVREVR